MDWMGIQDDGRYPYKLLLHVMHIHSLEVLVVRLSHSDVCAIALLLVTFDAVVNLSSSSWCTSCLIINHSSQAHFRLQMPRSNATTFNTSSLVSISTHNDAPIRPNLASPRRHASDRGSSGRNLVVLQWRLDFGDASELQLAL